MMATKSRNDDAAALHQVIIRGHRKGGSISKRYTEESHFGAIGRNTPVIKLDRKG